MAQPSLFSASERSISPLDLLHTARHLQDKMLEPQFGADDLYWSSLPTHLRNFIRNALPLAANTALSNSQSRILPGGVRGAGGQMAMYTMAQNIVSAASRSSTTDPDMLQAVSSRRVSVTSPVGLLVNQSIERKTSELCIN
jgi:hypothetical protein